MDGQKAGQEAKAAAKRNEKAWTQTKLAWRQTFSINFIWLNGSSAGKFLSLLSYLQYMPTSYVGKFTRNLFWNLRETAKFPWLASCDLKLLFFSETDAPLFSGDFDLETIFLLGKDVRWLKVFDSLAAVK